MRERGETLETVRQKIESSVRYANITTIEGNDASQFGIGIVWYGSEGSFSAMNARCCQSAA
jgi:hypothetical protein